jgi:hypothetical protein
MRLRSLHPCSYLSSKVINSLLRLVGPSCRSVPRPCINQACNIVSLGVLVQRVSILTSAIVTSVYEVLDSAPNAGPQARLEAEARHERTLEGVACRPSLGWGVPRNPNSHLALPRHRPTHHAVSMCMLAAAQSGRFITGTRGGHSLHANRSKTSRWPPPLVNPGLATLDQHGLHRWALWYGPA